MEGEEKGEGEKRRLELLSLVFSTKLHIKMVIKEAMFSPLTKAVLADGRLATIMTDQATLWEGGKEGDCYHSILMIHYNHIYLHT